jgi:hypothetical protein
MMKYNPLSVVRDCLSNIFSATAHLDQIDSIRNLRTHQAVVTRDPLGRVVIIVPVMIVQGLQQEGSDAVKASFPLPLDFWKIMLEI